MTLNRTKLNHDWTLIDDGIRESIDSHYYRLMPPKWSVFFAIPTSQEETLEWEVQRSGEMLIDEILKNPQVKKEVDRRISEARHEGYFGGLDEVYSRKKFDLGG